MARRRSRLILFLFALLQCVAPLLHAHIHAQGHGGVHLHGWIEAHAHGQAGHWAQTPHNDGEAAVGLSPALQPRPDATPALLESRGPALGQLRLVDVHAPAPGRTPVLSGPPPTR